jgi:TPR repeat protein
VFSFAVYLAAICNLSAQEPTDKSDQDLIKRAASGDARAEFDVAQKYQGETKPDYGEALKWYKKAADQNLGIAMTRIGDFYAKGNGVEKDLDKAVAWYRKAMASGQQSFAEAELLELSQTGQIKEKLAGLPVEGGVVLSDIDETTPIADLVNSLSKNTGLVGTGKAYWIGYNAVMMSIAARGDEALPFLVDL